MSAIVTRAADGTVTGNTHDKDGSSNAVARRLVTGFVSTLDGLLPARLRPILDVGCGEGVLTHRWAARQGAEPRVPGDPARPAPALNLARGTYVRRDLGNTPAT